MINWKFSVQFISLLWQGLTSVRLSNNLSQQHTKGHTFRFPVFFKHFFYDSYCFSSNSSFSLAAETLRVWFLRNQLLPLKPVLKERMTYRSVWQHKDPSRLLAYACSRTCSTHSHLKSLWRASRNTYQRKFWPRSVDESTLAVTDPLQRLEPFVKSLKYACTLRFPISTKLHSENNFDVIDSHLMVGPYNHQFITFGQETWGRSPEMQRIRAAQKEICVLTRNRANNAMSRMESLEEVFHPLTQKRTTS